MRLFHSVLFLLAFAASAIGQSFECQPVGAFPMDASASCNGVVSNNLGFGSGVSATAACGFPTAGSQYAALFAAGPVAAPAGGPVARPLSAATELRISIPAGAANVSLSWNFFNAEGGPQNTYNDGASIDVVNASGSIVGNLLYVDTNVPLASAGCGVGEVAPAGVKSLQAMLPIMSACDYLSIVVWNGGDNAYSSSLHVDNVIFNSVNAGCPVPCFVAAGAPSLNCTSPYGAGSLAVNMIALPVGGTYVLAVTLNSGSYPNGWLYGLDISMQELNNELNMGFPFVGPVSASGCSSGSAVVGPVSGAPSGLTFYAVALGIQGTGLSGSVTAATNTVAYTIP